MPKTVIQGLPMSHIAMGLAVLILLSVLPAFVNPKGYRRAMEELFANNWAVRATGILALFIAFFILNTHWTVKLNSTRSIMTVLGYLLVLKGVVRVWFPGFCRTMVTKFFKNDLNTYILATLGLIIGLGVGYLGIWVY
jgi:uncharacterized protein YjeT (DUF2065 family)